MINKSKNENRSKMWEKWREEANEENQNQYKPEWEKQTDLTNMGPGMKIIATSNALLEILNWHLHCAIHASKSWLGLKSWNW